MIGEESVTAPATSDVTQPEPPLFPAVNLPETRKKGKLFLNFVEDTQRLIGKNELKAMVVLG